MKRYFPIVIVGTIILGYSLTPYEVAFPGADVAEREQQADQFDRNKDFASRHCNEFMYDPINPPTDEQDKWLDENCVAYGFTRVRSDRYSIRWNCTHIWNGRWKGPNEWAWLKVRCQQHFPPSMLLPPSPLPTAPSHDKGVAKIPGGVGKTSMELNSEGFGGRASGAFPMLKIAPGSFVTPYGGIGQIAPGTYVGPGRTPMIEYAPGAFVTPHGGILCSGGICQ